LELTIIPGKTITLAQCLDTSLLYRTSYTFISWMVVYFSSLHNTGGRNWQHAMAVEINFPFNQIKSVIKASAFIAHFGN
ncbi:hypothetical protein L9F63_002646, partial [Diploptera punctata]